MPLRLAAVQGGLRLPDLALEGILRRLIPPSASLPGGTFGDLHALRHLPLCLVLFLLPLLLLAMVTVALLLLSLLILRRGCCSECVASASGLLQGARRCRRASLLCVAATTAAVMLAFNGLP